MLAPPHSNHILGLVGSALIRFTWAVALGIGCIGHVRCPFVEGAAHFLEHLIERVVGRNDQRSRANDCEGPRSYRNGDGCEFYLPTNPVRPGRPFDDACCSRSDTGG